MSASAEFRRIFTRPHLEDLYRSEIRYKYTPGIDGIKPTQFESGLDESIKSILRKVNRGTYRFSQYREKLFSRGPKKYPRVISIPTLRDKLVLKALYELIASVYRGEARFLHETISKVKEEYKMGLWGGVIRTDIRDFYPSINHQILLSILRKKIRKREIICLLESAIDQVTIAKPESKKR